VTPCSWQADAVSQVALPCNAYCVCTLQPPFGPLLQNPLATLVRCSQLVSRPQPTRSHTLRRVVLAAWLRLIEINDGPHAS